MGLDMYWYVEKTKEEKTQALLEGADVHGRIEIGYFRKFHDLNDYMGELYPENVQKAGFNCVDLEIGEKELDAMRRFKIGPYHPEDVQTHLTEICNQIETCLKQDRRVWYWPWW